MPGGKLLPNGDEMGKREVREWGQRDEEGCGMSGGEQRNAGCLEGLRKEGYGREVSRNAPHFEDYRGESPEISSAKGTNINNTYQDNGGSQEGSTQQAVYSALG